MRESLSTYQTIGADVCVNICVSIRIVHKSYFGVGEIGGVFQQQLQPLPATPGRAAQEELRIDPSDGKAYPRWSFLEVYGDLDLWDLATPVGLQQSSSSP